MPLGLDGVVGEGGVSLSGGQRQRLALARIFLRATNLVILDDPLSAVDTTTEAKIIANLSRCWTTQTVIWSSNKLSSLACCHVIALLTPGGLEFSKSRPVVMVGAIKDVRHDS
jgi:ABC-type bacteriocin/lantibiotic exporter with double-glycine peptidase domain